MTQVNIILVDAVKIEDWETFYFILGRLLRTILIVVPLEKEDYEDGDPFSSSSSSSLAEFDLPSNFLEHGPVVGFSRSRTADEMNWFWIAYFLVKGFGDKTIGYGSTYRTTFCYFNLRDIINYASVDVPEYAEALDFTSFVTSITSIFEHIDPLFKECTGAYEEYLQTAIEYGAAFTDLNILGLNFAYHAPDIYEVVDKLVEKFN